MHIQNTNKVKIGELASHKQIPTFGSSSSCFLLVYGSGTALLRLQCLRLLCLAALHLLQRLSLGKGIGSAFFFQG